MNKSKPSRASKYEGLLKIYYYGLPHPNWIFIEEPGELGKFCEIPVKYGWTLRTCLKTSGKDIELNLPYENNLTKEELPTKIKEIKKSFPKSLIFVIYPSWEFEKSGNYLLLEDRAVIEAIDGYLGELTDGRRNPKVTLFFDRFSRRLLSSQGDITFLSEREIQDITKYNRIITENNVVNEWSITKDGDLFFHHWIEL